MARSSCRTGFAIGLALLLFSTACGGSSDDGGESGGELSLGDEVPDYFPSDFYLPADMTIEGVSRSGDMISLTGTFDDGDIGTIQSDLVTGLQAAGYELLTADETAVFVKNGVGRVRVRTSEFLDELTVSVDIDGWSDEQLDELRDLFAEEITVPGTATATFGDETLDAQGTCTLQGTRRSFFADDTSITLQIDETQDPVYVYADVTTADGRVFSTEYGVEIPYESTPERFFASGDMIEFNGDDQVTVAFTVTAGCDVS